LQSKYPLQSFSDSSFQSSDSQLNVADAQSSHKTLVKQQRDEDSDELTYQQASSPEDEGINHASSSISVVLREKYTYQIFVYLNNPQQSR